MDLIEKVARRVCGCEPADSGREFPCSYCKNGECRFLHKYLDEARWIIAAVFDHLAERGKGAGSDPIWGKADKTIIADFLAQARKEALGSQEAWGPDVGKEVVGDSENHEEQ